MKAIVFGQVLKELRTQAALSQEVLAHDSGLDRTYISLLERGLRQPSIETLFKLASSLQLSAASLIGKVEERLLNCNTKPDEDYRVP